MTHHKPRASTKPALETIQRELVDFKNNNADKLDESFYSPIRKLFVDAWNCNDYVKLSQMVRKINLKRNWLGFEIYVTRQYTKSGYAFVAEIKRV